MSTLEERVTAIEQHLGLNVIHGVFTEPLVPGAQVTYWDEELGCAVTIERDEYGYWENLSELGWVRDWDYWVDDARPGSIRRVR